MGRCYDSESKKTGGKFEFEFLISDENAEIIAHISRQQRPPKNVM
jgi:hypothetical protein